MTNLILDFGGVIYQISHQKQQEAFAAYGINNFEALYSQALQSPLFADLERGMITEKDFKTAVAQMIGRQISESEIEFLWNSILMGFSHEAVQLIEKLRQRYQLFLLSNSNILHYTVFMEEFTDHYEYDFNSLFSKAYWSFEMGMRKPDAEIFQFLLNEHGFAYDDTLFIDDTDANIAAAESAGIKSWLLGPNQVLGDLFDEDLRFVHT
jgi:putative hydrolase of the HAD superfamily